ncbi:MAG: nickel pincer cofactor biosynthesis protein LarB [Candidatus Lokiarchaeota archaeon]|nr:nickel pincer cofactor biosynthesis protein LarB [Candidatus Lokiarchaeota archaeon]MBD3338755.1 nickel pincer cofactor biosynthesis protein LarB [Candidatus Lokiarchaeota archaeon]
MRKILEKVTAKEISFEEAEKLLKANVIEKVGEIAQLDVLRQARTGIPEVILAENKTIEILLEIIQKFLEKNRFVIISRFNQEQKEVIVNTFESNSNYILKINSIAKIITIKSKDFKFPSFNGLVGLITAGSSDISVAEEAKEIILAMGCEVMSSYDVGIAGIHRIFKPLSEMTKKGVQVIIVCAGMEGTLPGVVAALVDVPVIGVPVSSGYGLGEKGKGALTTMLQSCSPGLLVVNIDNGFGAGASAALIANNAK